MLNKGQSIALTSLTVAAIAAIVYILVSSYTGLLPLPWQTADKVPPIYLSNSVESLEELDDEYTVHNIDEAFEPSDIIPPAERQALNTQETIVLQCEAVDGVWAFGVANINSSFDIAEIYTRKFQQNAAKYIPGCTPRIR